MERAGKARREPLRNPSWGEEESLAGERIHIWKNNCPSNKNDSAPAKGLSICGSKSRAERRCQKERRRGVSASCGKEPFY